MMPPYMSVNANQVERKFETHLRQFVESVKDPKKGLGAAFTAMRAG